MLKQGTTTRNAKQIAESVAELGATLNIGAQYGSRTTDIMASSLTENLGSMLDIAVDVLPILSSRRMSWISGRRAPIPASSRASGCTSRFIRATRAR